MKEYKRVETDLLDNTGEKYEFAEVNEEGVAQAYKRKDGDWDVPVELPIETIAQLALEAHRQNITLNQLIVKIIEAKIEEEKSKV